MKALTVIPLQAGTATLSDMPEPPESDGPVLVETLAVGVCGTDIEILSGEYGWAPSGEERLVLALNDLLLQFFLHRHIADGDDHARRLALGIQQRTRHAQHGAPTAVAVPGAVFA